MESCAFLSLLNVNNKFSQHLHVNNKETSFLKCSILFCCTEKIEQSKNTLHCFFLLCSMRNAFRTNENAVFFFAIKRWKTWNIRPKNSKCMRIKSSDCISNAHRCVLIHFDCIYLHIVISTSVMLIFCFTRFPLFVGKWCFCFCSVQQWPSNPNSSAFYECILYGELE